MKSDKLLNAMGNLSDDLINEARPGKGRTLGRSRRWSRWVAAALAAVLVLVAAVGAGASMGVFHQVEDPFTAMFRLPDKVGPLDMELVEKMGQQVGVSAVSNGVTITVDSALRDRHIYMMLLSIHMEGLDENTLELDKVVPGGCLKGLGGSSWGAMDLEPGDDTIQIRMQFMHDEGFSDEPVKLTLERLVLNPREFMRERTIAGTWELEFEVDYEDMVISLPGGQEVEAAGIPLRIEEVTVSPLSIMAKFTAYPGDHDLSEETVKVRHDAGINLQNRLALLDLQMTTADGVKYASPDYSAQSHIQGNGGHLDVDSPGEDGGCEGYSILYFERPVALEEIASVTVEGVEIPIE